MSEPTDRDKLFAAIAELSAAAGSKLTAPLQTEAGATRIVEAITNRVKRMTAEKK